MCLIWHPAVVRDGPTSCRRLYIRSFGANNIDGICCLWEAALSWFNMGVRGNAESSSGESRIALIAREAFRLLNGECSLEEVTGLYSIYL